ncbi:MAG: hypothetical protein WDN04_05030 [Rhodospirillales bacterium]
MGGVRQLRGGAGEPAGAACGLDRGGFQSAVGAGWRCGLFSLVAERVGAGVAHRSGGRGGGCGAGARDLAAVPVGAFAVAPDGRTLVVSLAVFPDCETPACTKKRQDARKSQKNSGQVYDKLFVRHWDEWADGTRNHLFALHLDAAGVATGDAVPLMAHFDGDTPGKPFGDDADFAISPDSRTVVSLGAGGGAQRTLEHQLRSFRSGAGGRCAAEEFDGGEPGLGWVAGVFAGRKAARLQGDEAGRVRGGSFRDHGA